MVNNHHTLKLSLANQKNSGILQPYWSCKNLQDGDGVTFTLNKDLLIQKIDNYYYTLYPRGEDMEEPKNVAMRLKIARGHLDKVIEMVESDEYCIDILQQSIAVQNALKRADEVVLSKHLETCVRGALSNKEKNKQMKEILEVFKKGRR